MLITPYTVNSNYIFPPSFPSLSLSLPPLLPLSGIVRVSLADMDREVRDVYQVVIQAKDMGGLLGGLAGTTTVNITLSDVNDNPPKFSQSKDLSLSLSISIFSHHCPHFCFSQFSTVACTNIFDCAVDLDGL